jgi:diguanylate cyclase (GGDEF)-like protein
MSDEDFMLVLEEVSELLPAAAATFEVDLYDGVTVNAILEKSKEILMMRNLQAVRQTERLQRTAETLESRTRELEENSRRDGLTGLFNRRHLDEFLAKEFDQAQSHGWPLSLAFVDLDHFKQVNDNHGHQAGDLVLQGAADLLQDGVRPSDVVARYGGEEFVVLLCGTDRAGAVEVSKRLVETFRDKKHNIGNERALTVTASIGVATFDAQTQHASVEALLKAADEAVYQAKSQGRDRFVIYES